MKQSILLVSQMTLTQKANKADDHILLQVLTDAYARFISCNTLISSILCLQSQACVQQYQNHTHSWQILNNVILACLQF